MRIGWLSLVGLLGLSGCRDHTLEDGIYALAVGEVLRDDCGVASDFTLGPGRLTTTGHVVAFSLDAPAVTLAGWYRDSIETFYADGSLVDAPVRLGARDCLVETLAVHLDAETQDAARFAGVFAFDSRSAREPACSCRLWLRATGTRAGP